MSITMQGRYVPRRPVGAWAERAACIGMWSVMHMDGGGNGVAEKAKAVCATCPVIEECLAHALAQHEPLGVWGGLTPSERHALEVWK